MRAKVIVLWSAIVIVLLFVFVFVAIKAFVSPDAIAELIVPHIEKAFGRDVKVGAGELTIFSGIGARIHNVTVSNKSPFESRPLATIASIDVRLRLIPLLWGDLKIKRLTVNGCQVYLVSDSSGVNNYDFLGPKKAVGKEFQAAGREPFCREFALYGARLLYRNDSTGVRMAWGGVDFRFDLNGGEESALAGSVRVDSLLAWSPGGDFLIYPSAAEAALSGTYYESSDSISIEECDWRIDKFSGMLNGSVGSVSQSPDFNLHLLSEHTNLAASKDSRIIKAFKFLNGLALAGELRIDATYQGRLGDTSASNVRGKVNITDAAVGIAGSESSVKVKLIESNFNEQSLSIYTEGATVGEAPALFRLAIDNFADPTISGELKLACDAGLLGELAGMERRKELSGKVDVALSGFVRSSDKEQARLFGSLAIEGLSYYDPAVNWRLDTLNLICSFGGSDAELTRSEVVIGGNRLQLSGKIVGLAPYLAALGQPRKRPQFNFVCAADSFNFDTLAIVNDRSRWSDTSLVLHALDYLIDFDARGRLQVGSGTFAGVAFDELRSDIAVVNRIVSSDSTLCRLFGGAAVGAVVIDVANLTSPEFEIDIIASDLQANDLVSHFTQFKDHLVGRLDLQATFRGTGLTTTQIAPTLTGEGRATMRDGEVNDYDLLSAFRDRFGIEAIKDNEFENLQGAFKIVDQGFQFNPLSFKSGKTTYQVDGRVGFDGTPDYRVTRTLSKDEARALADLPEGRELMKGRNTAKAVFRFAGNADTVNMEIESVVPKE
jgi:uncharacterized protein involved in outer membrane biogenesis